MMKRTIILSITAMMAAAVAADAQAIKGTVKDTDGKALAGVVVSDGLNTVQTDVKGRFKMVADAVSLSKAGMPPLLL